MSNIKYIQNLQPALQSGEYLIQVEHGIDFETWPMVEKSFAIQGERFSLKPDVIHSIFPPANSLGEHSNLLPHILFKKNTLPWERSPDSISETTPWLALLVFDEQDAPRIKDPNAPTTPINEMSIQTLGNLEPPSTGPGYFPGITLEYGQSIDDQVMVIDIEKDLLASLLPTWSDLALLAHAREERDESIVEETLSAVIANRLPTPGRTSVVHLVSLEDRFHNVGLGSEEITEFNFQEAISGDKIRLISLKNWQFTCLDSEQNYERLVKNLNLDLPGLRLPNTGNSDVDPYLQMGAVPLLHQMRGGDQIMSWYHGPLVTGVNPSTALLPILAADELLHYNETTGFLDSSYAAAWELGRLLALKNKTFSLSLYNWKRAYAQQDIMMDQQILSYLDTNTEEYPEAPELVENWFDNLNKLKNVPFSYLVPDEQLLPQESIRFFTLDSLWMDCLFDGAYSIGRVTGADRDRDAESISLIQNQLPSKVTGVIIRSQVVAGWPGLVLKGFSQKFDDNALNMGDSLLSIFHSARLSDTVMIYLFEGDVKTVDILLKSNSLHFGFDTDGESDYTYFKQVRNQNGVQYEPENIADHGIINEADYTVYPVNQGIYENNLIKDNRVLDITALAANINTLLTNLGQADTDGFASADFAMQMIEGTPRIRFTNESDA